MPPDPVLALLSFVGLFLYGGIGGVVAAAALRVLSPRNYFPYLVDQLVSVGEQDRSHTDG